MNKDYFYVDGDFIKNTKISDPSILSRILDSSMNSRWKLNEYIREFCKENKMSYNTDECDNYCCDNRVNIIHSCGFDNEYIVKRFCKECLNSIFSKCYNEDCNILKNKRYKYCYSCKFKNEEDMTKCEKCNKLKDNKYKYCYTCFKKRNCDSSDDDMFLEK